MYKPTIGLEIHIELTTKSKMFCSCRNDSDEKSPNLNICPVCLGHPGTLPVINKEAVRQVLKTALALNCQINKKSFFERKNYFYPDLPKGYQISQYKAPLGKGGWLEIQTTEENDGYEKSKIQMSNVKSNPNEQNSKFKKIRITRIHLEEDTGKLLHPEGKDYSLVDFNRAGIPLMELVTEPVITSSKEAKEFIRELQLILRYLGVSQADMEKGEMRAEVNISLLRKSQIPNPKSQSNPKSKIQNFKLGTKVEIKNLNSLSAVGKAIEYELKRQSEVLRTGGKVVQETRGWHDNKEITFSQREKEESHDYRYFPEPDLPPLEFEEGFLEKIKTEIPELPAQKRKRFKKEYFLSDRELELYTRQKDLGNYFEEVVSELRNWVKEKKFKKKISEEEFKKLTKLTSNYIATDLQALLKGKGEFREEKFPITPENFAEFISMVYLGEISSKIAKTLLLGMFESGQDPSQITEEKGLKLITDEKELEAAIKEVISENPKAVDDYKKGKEVVIQFLVGKLMAKTKGTASPDKTLKALKKALQ